MNHVVVGLGEVLWDLLPSGPQLGGAPANFAYQAAALGARSMVITRIGDDELGKEVLQRFGHMNLPVETVQIDPARPTGTVAVTLDANRTAHYTFAEDAAWEHLAVTDVALQTVRQADAVCFGTLAQRSSTSRQTIQQLVAAAPADALKVFDINLRLDFYSREVIEQSMHLANVLKLNDDELSILTRLFSVHAEGRKAIEWFVRKFELSVVALTCGAAGSLIYQQGRWSEIPPQPVQLVDTVGAGDAFAAALVVGLLSKRVLSEIHATAADLARHVCSQPGGTPPLPKDFREKFK